MLSKSNKQEIISWFPKIFYEDISELFKLVRKLVYLYSGKTRPGIMLGLVELGFNRGNFIGGFHYTGTNEIYLNKSALRVMKEESESDKYKAYLFFLLLHEYIHAVGYHNEDETQKLTKNMILDVFGKFHILGKLALFGLDHYFPYSFNNRSYKPSRRDLGNPEYVTLHQYESELTYL